MLQNNLARTHILTYIHKIHTHTTLKWVLEMKDHLIWLATPLPLWVRMRAAPHSMSANPLPKRATPLCRIESGSASFACGSTCLESGFTCLASRSAGLKSGSAGFESGSACWASGSTLSWATPVGLRTLKLNLLHRFFECARERNDWRSCTLNFECAEERNNWKSCTLHFASSW